MSIMKLFAGAARIEITPSGPVWMDGMIRAHRSEGVHDPLFARAVAFSDSSEARRAFVVVSVDVCALDWGPILEARAAVESKTGISRERVLVCVSHTHSGPATKGFFNPREDAYLLGLVGSIVEVAASAASSMRPARAEYGRADEKGVSFYRRLLADDGHVVMNWEDFPPERIVRCLGAPDPEVGLLIFKEAEPSAAVIATIFNHADHPNTLSGDSFVLSSEYPGLAARLAEERWGGASVYLNGAQGSIDIDNFKHRGLPGLEHNGRALFDAVSRAKDSAVAVGETFAFASLSYDLPARRVSAKEMAWADEILESTKGEIRPMADGVGDDYVASLLKRLAATQDEPIPVEQLGFAIGDCAFIGFPGELYTEVGLSIKEKSPFAHTHIIGLANGHIGYVPTRKAIEEGGYSENTREVDAAAAEIVEAKSLELLRALAAKR